MTVTRKTKISAIGLAGLLAAALSVGLTASVAATTFDEAKQERVTALGFEAEALTALDEDKFAEIMALLEADHDDETLTREIGAILDSDGEDDTAG